MSRDSVRLPADASAPSRARRYAASHCRQLPADALHKVTLLVSELVTNAVVHGGGDSLVDIDVEGGVVTVGVSDQGNGSVRPASRFSWPETGHGLTLVQAMSDRWGVDQIAGTTGKRVWFELTWVADDA
jgi:anti-sigma regulatory factor (Ser/Thr protein kinase)